MLLVALHLAVCVAFPWRAPRRSGVLALATAEFEAGRWSAAVNYAEAALAGTDDAEVQASAFLIRGRALDRSGEAILAEDSLWRANALASRAHAPGLGVTALIQLTYVIGRNPTRTSEAERIADLVALRIEELGTPPPARAQLDVALGVVAQAAGRPNDAVGHLRRALDTYGRTIGDDHPDALRAAINLGNALRAAGAPQEAEEVLRGAHAGLVRAHGLDHLDVAVAQADLALAVISCGRPRDAVALLQDSIATRERLDRHHPSIATARYNLAMAWQRAGEAAAAHGQFVAALVHRASTADPAGLAPFARGLADATAVLGRSR